MMKINQVIILAGGEGTRLQPALPGLPKCLAPVKGKPFIDYLITYLLSQQIEDFIFALGYKAGVVQEYLDANWPKINRQFSAETSPLGTGGALKKASVFAREHHILVINGDTLFKADLKTAIKRHESSGSACTILLKHLNDFDRFGTVTLNDNMQVTGFVEKQQTTSGLINTGVYLLDLKQCQPGNWPGVCSFEKDFLQEKCGKMKMIGVVQEKYFIDIGVPEDYKRAKLEL